MSSQYWAWVVAIATLFHLVGADGLLLPLIGGVLMIGLILGGFAVMFRMKPLEQVLRAFLLAAVILVFVPAVIAAILRDLWASHPTLLVLAALVAGGLWVLFARSADPKRAAWLSWGQSDRRSGSGKAVPIPRRWR